MIRALLLDLDGVLVSTDRLHRQAWETLTQRLGIPYGEETARRCLGLSRMDSLEVVLEQSPKTYAQEEKLRLAEEKNSLYRALLKDLSPADALPGVWDTLRTLRQRGYILVLASSSKNAPDILAQTGLGELLDAAADGNCVARAKPDPEVFRKAAELAHVPPEQCLAVDDAAAGVAAAHAAGMACAALGDAARQGLGDFVLARFDELLPLLPPLKEAGK